MTLDMPAVTLRELEAIDLDRLFCWRNDPDIYRWFRDQSGALDWNEHVEWFQSRPGERDDWIIQYRDNPVGIVSVTADGDVGILIGERRLWGKGIAKTALETVLSRRDGEQLTAEIHRDNERSQRLFESVGFRAVDADGPWLQYEVKA